MLGEPPEMYWHSRQWALCLQHRLALGQIAHLAAIAAAFEFSSHAPNASPWRKAAACACLVDRIDNLRPHRDRQTRGPYLRSSGSFAPGMDAAVSLPPSGAHQGIDGAMNHQAWGALTDASRCLRLPEARTARSCRPTPARIEAALIGAFRARGAIERFVLPGKLPARRIFPGLRVALEILFLGGGRRRHQHRGRLSRVGAGTFGLPVVRHDRGGARRTRCGKTRSRSPWAIMPPIDAPTRCADLMPSTSIRPTVSSAMSRSV